MIKLLSEITLASHLSRTSACVLVLAVASLFSFTSCTEEGERAFVGAGGGAIAGGILGGGRGAVAGAVIGGTLGALSTPSYSHGYYPRPAPPQYYNQYY